MTYRSKNRIIKIIYVAIDVVCVYFAIYASCLVRQKLIDFPVSFINLLVDPHNPYRFIFLLWILAAVLFMNSNSLYQTRREVLEGIEIWLVIKSVFLSSLVIIVTTYVMKIQGFPRTVFMNTTIAMIILLSSWRIVKRWLVEYFVIKGYNNFNALIIGAGKTGLALASEIRKRPGLGIRIVGFIDDFKNDIPEKEGIGILGKIADFVTIAQREFIDKIFITIHHDSNVFMKLLAEARELGIAVMVIPQGFDFISSGFFQYNIGFIPILEYSDIRNRRKQTGKRLFDFLLSSALGILLLPVFVIIAISIKLNSRGPVIYVSKRYGKGGRIFNMYKFRSMIAEADHIMDQLIDRNEVDGPIFKIKEDPRITKIGSFLRKYSLDELPQIINVFMGKMSLVGPRPLPINQIEKEDFKQLKRLEVKPGITGLWQTRGRSDISFARLVKWDIWYINNWSFWLDLNILFQTIPVVLKGKGAY